MEYMIDEFEANNKFIDLIVNNRYRLLRHSIFCIGFFILMFFSNWLSHYSGAGKYYRLLLVYSILLAMFYINIYVLVPVFFFRNRYLAYIVLLLLLALAGLVLINTLLSTYLPLPDHRRDLVSGLYESVGMIVTLISSSTTIKLFQRWARANERIAELKNITLTMELNELKNQINPHFLFNMLNGIKALVRSDPEKAGTVIMKLSDFLRYQLYENNEEKTMLKAEIDFLSNFLNLEKVRRDNLSVNVTCHTPAKTLNTIFLPPNLFTTFVENAIKHSADISGKESSIDVSIEVEEGRLYFRCINSKDSCYIAGDKKDNGLGLPNIKRRLELLYDKNYTLEIQSTDLQYIVNLTLPV